MRTATTLASPMRGINTIVRPDGREIHLDDIGSADEGQILLDELDVALISIEAQIDAVEAGTEQRDPDWRRRVGVALRRKRCQRPRLQQRISALRKAERLASFPEGAVKRKDAMKVAFVEAARELLDHEVYTEVWARARELHPGAFGPGGAA